MECYYASMLIIGHRGACGHEPENTLRSLTRAIDLGADMVEFDVKRCKTGELVIMHDMLVNRTTNGKGYVHELSYAELKVLDAGKGERIPTLAETLDCVNRRAQVNIEMVTEGIAGDVAAMIEDFVQSKRWSYDDFLVSSYFHQELKNFRSLMPKLRTGVLFEGVPLQLAQFATELGVYALHTWRDYLPQRFVDDAHARGLRVHCYTVNDEEDVLRMRSMGVDGIFTDVPDVPRKILEGNR
jgi:glycerophosphoryl diester phosphodiesterase